MRLPPSISPFPICVAVLAIAFVLLTVVRIVEPLGVDQGLFLCFARWVPQGWLPYRDLFDSKPPLFLYTYALSSLIPGDVTRAMWLLEAGWLAATIFVAYRAAAGAWDRWAGLATAALLLAGLWLPVWGGFWSRAQAEELLTLPMIGAAWAAWRGVERPRFALLAGLLTGVCGLYKIPSMAIAAAWAIAWFGCAPWPAVARRCALLAIGCLIPWAAAALWFLGHGAFTDFLDGVLVYHRYNFAYTASPWLDVARDFAYQMLTEATLLVVAGATGVILMIHRGQPRARWSATWIALTLAAVASQRQLFGYHYLLAIPALAFAGGYGIVEVVRFARQATGRARLLACVGLAGMALLGARDGASYFRAYSPGASFLLGRTNREAYLARIELGNYSLVTEERAAAYLRAHTSPGDGILVWGLSPGIYALADRHPVTRFPFHKLLMTDAPLSRMWPGLPARRADFMRRLRTDPPAYVLVGRRDSNGFEPETSLSSMKRFREFREWLEAEYRSETEIGHFLVYRRKPRGP